jgi:hypothetical protein
MIYCAEHRIQTHHFSLVRTYLETIFASSVYLHLDLLSKFVKKRFRDFLHGAKSSSCAWARKTTLSSDTWQQEEFGIGGTTELTLLSRRVVPHDDYWIVKSPWQARFVLPTAIR